MKEGRKEPSSVAKNREYDDRIPAAQHKKEYIDINRYTYI